MIVETETLNKWRIKKRSGDQKKISDQTGISENAISRAFNGISSEETIQAINNFYKIK